MNEVYMCRRLYKGLKEEKKIEGKLHSIFNRVVNIIWEEDLISIFSKGNSMMPMSILINKEINFRSLDLLQGMNVVISKYSILIKETGLRITFKDINLWDSKPNYDYKKCKETEYFSKIDEIEKFILDFGSLDGIAPLVFNISYYIKDIKTSLGIRVPLNNYSDFIIERIAEFLQNIIHNRVSRIAKSSKGIIGFGPGLTPSIDDFVAGLMISFVYLSDYYDLDKHKLITINRKIVKEIKNRTTKVSEIMLMFASRGECSDVLRRLMHSLLSGVDKIEFFNSLKGVIDLGETSGTDTLSGIYIGCKIMQNENFRRFFNGSKC